MTGARETPSPFWTFSLRLYGLPGVPPACLALQDSSGVDVNIMLFMLFAAHSGRRLTADDARRFMEAAAVWKDGVVAPLRHVRRLLKEFPGFIDAAGVEALRARVKAVELEAERLQQEALFAHFPVAGLGNAESRATAAAINLEAFAASLDARFDEDATRALLDAFSKLEDKPS